MKKLFIRISKKIDEFKYMFAIGLFYSVLQKQFPKTDSKIIAIQIVKILEKLENEKDN